MLAKPRPFRGPATQIAWFLTSALLLASMGCGISPISSSADNPSSGGSADGSGGTSQAEGLDRELSLKLADVTTVVSRGADWRGENAHPFTEKAVVALGRPHTITSVDISLDNNDVYRVAFLMGTTEVGSLQVGPAKGLNDGLERYDLIIPPEFSGQPVDSIVITEETGDAALSIGHILLTESNSPGSKGEAGSDEAPTL